MGQEREDEMSYNLGKKYKFKVVKKKSRRSAMINGNSKYSLIYEKGSEVFAMDGTLGVFVFRLRTDAQRWVDSFLTPDLMIVRVLPIERGKSPYIIAPEVTSYGLNRFYKDSSAHYSYFISESTMCYPGVYVID